MANDTDLPQSGRERQHAGFDADSESVRGAAPPRFSRLALCMATAGALAIGVLGTIAYGVWFDRDQQAYADAIAGARQALRLPNAGAGTRGSRVTAATPGESALSASPDASPGSAAPTSLMASAETPRMARTLDSHGSPEGNVGNKGNEDEEGIENERGKEQAVWSGRVGRPPAPFPVSPPLADAGLTAAPTSPTVAPRPAAQRTASYTASATRRAKDGRSAQPGQGRRATQGGAKKQGGLFARMGMLFRHVSYPQHGDGRQQPDLYSHP